MPRLTGADLYTCSLAVTFLPPSQLTVTTSFEGSMILATVTVTPKVGATDVGYLTKVGLMDTAGQLSWSGAAPYQNAKADIIGVQRTTGVASWLAQAAGADPPIIVPVLEGGYWSMPVAAQYNANPAEIVFGQCTRTISWVLRYMIRVRQGATGFLNLRAWCDSSDDSLLRGGPPALSGTTEVPIAKGGVNPQIDPPDVIAAIPDPIVPKGAIVTWAWASGSADHRESAVLVEAADPIGGFYPDTTPGPFSVVAFLPPGATTWRESALTGARRFYRVSRISLTTTGDPSAIASAVPTASPSAMAAATVPVVTAQSYNALFLLWTAATQLNCAYWRIDRREDPGDPWDEVAMVGANTQVWVDRSAAAKAVYYYRIVAIAYDGSVVDTGASTAGVGLPSLPSGVVIARTLYLQHGYPVQLRAINGCMFFLSQGSRARIFDGTGHFRPGGLLPFLEAGALTSPNTGSLTGTFEAYATLMRKDGTESTPSPASAPITVTNSKITLTMPDTAGYVRFRDNGEDILGGVVPAPDAWRFYLRETTAGGVAWEVGVYSLDEPVVETPAGLTAALLADGSRRPMQTTNQSTIAPAVSEAEYKDGRVAYGAEATFVPAQGSAGYLTFTDGSTNVTANGYVFTDALLGKEVVLGDVATGWQVIDVISTTSLTIAATDPALQYVKWQGGTGNRTDFRFSPVPGKVYFSALGNWGPSGSTVFSPETINPATSLQTEVDADDGNPITSIYSSRDSWIIGKMGKVFSVGGGGIPDSPDADNKPGDGFAQDIQPYAVTRTRGIVAPRSVARGPDGTLVYLDSDGPCLASASGVQNIGAQIAASRVFRSVFETSRLKDAVGCWLHDQRLYVCMGIDCIGNAGGLDGFIWSEDAGWMARLRFPRRITATDACERDDGKWQALIGDESGMVGVGLAETSTEDDVDLSGRNDPYDAILEVNSDLVPQVLQGPLTDSGRADVAVGFFAPVLRSFPGTTASDCQLAVQKFARMGAGLGNSDSMVPTATADFTSLDGPNIKDITKARGQVVRVRFRVTAARNERIEIYALDMVQQVHRCASSMVNNA